MLHCAHVALYSCCTVDSPCKRLDETAIERPSRPASRAKYWSAVPTALCRAAHVAPALPLLPRRVPNCLVTVRHQEHGGMAMARSISAVAAISVIAVTLCLPSWAAQPNPASGDDSELKQNFAAELEVGRR